MSAVNGTPDTTFSTNLGTGFNGNLHSVAVQRDGKVVVGGYATTINGVSSPHIFRLNADGTPDTLFAANLGSGFNDLVLAVTVQRDGKIVAGGFFTALNGVSTGRIARLHPDGTPDTTFTANLGAGFNSTVLAVAVQGDGRVVVAGTFTGLNGVSHGPVVRLNADGTRDPTFSSSFIIGFGGVWDVALQGDGKIVVCGSFTYPTNRLARLNTDGTVDAAFGANLGTGFNTFVNSVAIRGDGRIVVGGAFTMRNGVADKYVSQLNADGTPDSAFTTNLGTGLNFPVSTIALQGDGRLVLGGTFTSLNGVTSNRIARLNVDGTPDVAFTANIGTGFDQAVNAVDVQGDGKIVVVGNFNTLNGSTSVFIARLDAPALAVGTPDTAFSAHIGTGFNSTVQAVAVQGDGKIVVGGSATTVNGISSIRLARLDAAGTPDTAFSANLGTGFNGIVTAVTVQTDGKVVVGGDFTALNGVTRNRLCRLNADGTPDAAFSANLGLGLNGVVAGLALQPDGAILVAGAFTAVNGGFSNRLARLHADGTPDKSFLTNLGTGFDNIVESVAVQGDGKIVAGGFFTGVNGVSSNRIARLNANGAPDTAFSTNTGTGLDGWVESVVVQGNGQILAGGFFTSLNGVPANQIARLAANGTPDTTFATGAGTGFANGLKAIALQGDGRIVAAGVFTTFNGAAASRVARLHVDGTLDATFTANLGGGFNGPVEALAIQGDGQIVAGGSFTTLNGATSNRIARLGATVPGAPRSVTPVGGYMQATVSFTVPENTGTAAITSYTAIATPGGATQSGAASPLVIAGLTNGAAYTVTVTATNQAGTGAASSPPAAVTPAAAVPGVTMIAPTSGSTAGGTIVTITGTDFLDGQTTVAIGGSAATSVSVLSGTSLQARTPSGVAGPATVAVTTVGGTGSLVNGFTYFVSLVTDDPLQPRLTPIKAVHITELRQRIADLRARYPSLPVFMWTDSALTAGVTAVKVVHLAELRTALNDVYVQAGSTPPSYSAIVPGVTVITAIHIAEIRAAIVALW